MKLPEVKFEQLSKRIMVSEVARMLAEHDKRSTHAAEELAITVGEMDTRLSKQFIALRTELSNKYTQESQFMADVTLQMKAVFDKIDLESKALADRILAAIGRKTDDMDEAEAAPLLAEGQAIADALKNLVPALTAPVPPPATEPPASAEPSTAEPV